MPSWTISNNHIVSTGTTVPQAEALLDPTPAPPNPPSDLPDPVGNGHADTFRFDAVGSPDVVKGLVFGEGDRIVLENYARGTFQGTAGGNVLDVTSDGTSVTIDSLADIRELDAASADVHTRLGGLDKLVLDIDQAGGLHSIQLVAMAHNYFG